MRVEVQNVSRSIEEEEDASISDIHNAIKWNLYV